ncbi:GIY-YIG nuclease family protein [Sulfitobacter sp. F26169L]|uniref:GIY-YIG nuclease family protein n=1 Tax=Sulfitobacter sp. F26169L TaxID=2996015 RepID=UPI0022608153|nr:GIY-YIG nuclease family protein [Sulfitobacter sp. F26169L]MCX7567157.1 GIY-YIG nuclease family protein [Sulfitobacter sp. F26169L]
MTNTLTIAGTPVPVFPGKILPHWIEAAHAKGYDIAGRIIDRLHLALRCHLCGEIIQARLFTLMSAQPLCSACIKSGWITTAKSVGLVFIDQCPENRHYAWYEAPCGHTLRRQFELIKRVAAGETGIRCEICHHATEEAEADARGWELVGADPNGDPNYRQYKHIACDHKQRIARTNLQTDRFSCGGCGELWPAAPSNLYVMSFTLPNSRELVKLGYSNNPLGRLRNQLVRNKDLPCEILRTVPVDTGQQAISLEKALHAKLREAHPATVVDSQVYSGLINVKTEIYEASLTAIILDELDAIATNLASTAS